jgi:HPt (histidine-containing phosphotransfer) domain-containing protein
MELKRPTYKEEIMQADADLQAAIRQKIPEAELEQIGPILQRLLAEYRKKQQEIWRAHRKQSISTSKEQ